MASRYYEENGVSGLHKKHSHREVTRKCFFAQLSLFIVVSFALAVLPHADAQTVTGLSPNSGAVGTSITISGNSFGSTQGTSAVTFNGTNGMPTNWSDTSIVVPVPSGATTGNVVVTVGGVASNGVNFTVLVPGFSPTGSLATARMFHTATLLNSGGVLVVGGVDGFTWNPIASGELYNTATGTFSPSGNLNNGRIFNTATLLTNGKVLVAGGADSNWNNIAP